jgi:hypothetical protein
MNADERGSETTDQTTVLNEAFLIDLIRAYPRKSAANNLGLR